MPGPYPLDTGAPQLLFVSALTDLWTVPSPVGSNFQNSQDRPGAIRREFNGVYKCVQFGASLTTNVTAALAQGDIACYVSPAGNATLDELILADEPNSAIGAGVVMSATGVPATGGPYQGWLLVGGTTTLDQAIGGTTPAVGNELTTTSATAKTLTKRAAVTDMAVGILVDNTISAAPVVNVNFPW